jgi:zinc transport system ATP-binding protein
MRNCPEYKAGDPIVSFHGVSFSYNSEQVLEKVTLDILPKDFIWIVGPNGGGKTTLIKLLMGLLRPRSGRISVFGSPVEECRDRIGYMPQHAHLDLKFPVTVLDVTLMGRLRSGVHLGRYSSDDRLAALEALASVSLDDQANRRLGELSGGQQRRLLIARALACNPELLVLDEPTANLDRVVEGELFSILRELSKRMTVIMVSHDPAFVSDFVKSVVCVNKTVSVHPTTRFDSEFMDDLYRGDMRIVRHDQHEHHSHPDPGENDRG